MEEPALMTEGHRLRGGESLRRQSLTSLNDAFTLKHFGFDDLILIRNHDRHPLWWSSTISPQDWRRKRQDKVVSTVTLLPDGDLVALDENGTALWSTGTAGRGVELLEVRDDGGVVLLDGTGEIVWHTGTATTDIQPPPFAVARGDRMLVGQSLADQSLTSPNGRYVLVHDHQHGGTFLYGPDGRLTDWFYLVAAGYPDRFRTRLVLEEDGLFLRWSTGEVDGIDLRDVRKAWDSLTTPGFPFHPKQVVVRDNGDLEMLDADGEVMWCNGVKRDHPDFARPSNDRPRPDFADHLRDEWPPPFSGRDATSTPISEIQIAGISRYRLFRRPSAGRDDWAPAGQLAVLIERAGLGEAAGETLSETLTEIGWRTTNGAEASLTLPGLIGTYRSPDGVICALRAEPVQDETSESAMAADYRLFEGDDEQPLSQNPLRLLLDDGAGWPVRLSWRSATGESGHAVFAPALQDGHTAKVVDIQATAEHPDAGEVARNLLDRSAATKWFAPVPRAELTLRLSTDRTVVRYDLDSANDAPDRDPRDWELLGFCGNRWIVVDERHGERFGGRLSSRTFTVAQPGKCERYRLRITGNAGSPHLQLGGLRLHTLEGPEPPPNFLGWYQRPGEAAVPLRGFLIRQETPPVPPVSGPADDASEAVPTTPQHWSEWISAYSEQWFRTASEEDLEHVELPPTGLTRPPVDIAAIEHAETRLGVRLPASLRSFCQATDGLLQAGPFGERILPLTELGWLRETNADLLDAWWGVSDDGDEDDGLSGLLLRALQIGGSDDGDYWFLDPAETTDGEWAAYTWHPSDGSEPERHDNFAAMLNDGWATLERFRAHEGRPAHPEGADDLLAEGRGLALAGDVTAAHETLNRAMDAGSAVAAYLDAQVRLFAFPNDWHEATLRNGVLGNDHVMAAIDDDHLRGDLIPMYLALTSPGHTRPAASFARRLTRYVSRINALPGRPAAEGEQDDPAWEAFASTLIGDSAPDPAPFGRACAVARELVQLGRPDDAWPVLRDALPSWRPDSPLRVMPTVLITDPVLRTIMTPERRLIAAVTRQPS
jgi:hypothetical protein